MNEAIYQNNISIRWADLDPNFHVRHSVYYDWGAAIRMDFLSEHGLTTEVLMQLGIGPILFKEECEFRREIKFGDKVTINVKLLKARKDFSRWSLQHELIKNDKLAALITVHGAWIDVRARKLAPPPPQAVDVFSKITPSDNFIWE